MNLNPIVTLGDIMVAVTFITTMLGVGLRLLTMLRRLERNMDLVMIEHEMLMGDYCSRLGIDANKLPTRVPRPSR